MIQAKVLADRLIAGEGLWWDAARVVAANLLLVLCAWIALPLPWTPVPVTGQTFGVMFVAVLLGARRSALVLVLYLAEGLAGLPVFQPFGLPGAERLAGPTAGYLLAYPPAAYLAGWLVERAAGRRNGFPTVRLVGALTAGEAVTFVGGCAWLATTLRTDFAGALSAGLLPFLPGELIKMALVLAAARGVALAAGRREASAK